MPPKKKVDLPDHVREAALADVELSHQQALDAEERDRVRVFLATEQGLSTYEIADRLGVSQQTVSNWRRQGEEVYRRREAARSRRSGNDPDRPTELGAVG
ncbi:helix-turn-helix domain-containing protein [Streptomyces formicae]|uniref:Helix-turn-helix domain-containing protein n=1 Tax=Streptomyces formicae TaxID=1616117 RepID=A0ABY3WNJ2_9ACTN|nr:helix-turn-helix domain-containing protein [Streptomyces formicae]UNM12357.1 helix-turn-helix domain-containing protein [Streptomyces formicae]